jgi:hypothetical protein
MVVFEGEFSKSRVKTRNLRLLGSLGVFHNRILANISVTRFLTNRPIVGIFRGIYKKIKFAQISHIFLSQWLKISQKMSFR